jgi:hypothetical protein
MQKDLKQAEARQILYARLAAMLEAGQNVDGGWGFHPGAASRVEPTCWAIQALSDAKDTAEERVAHGVAYLKAQQLSDGSWPVAGTPQHQDTGGTDDPERGGWTTSLACSVLARAARNQPANGVQPAIEAGLQWLCDDYPRDSSVWHRFLKKLQIRKDTVEHNDEFRGWGWTPRTSSWVEPTASALIAFAEARSVRLAKAIAERRSLAIGLLYDRMCPSGGWNCGNPRVYGVDGEALILPTCWALLALRNEPEHPQREFSVVWLRKAFLEIESAASLAVAVMTLESYGISANGARRSLCDSSAADLAERGIHVMAWVAMALSPVRSWPTSSTLVAQ